MYNCKYMSVFREKYRYKVLRYLGAMAVNTSKLATIFKTNLASGFKQKSHYYFCALYALLFIDG